jgi:hypothetical protein
VTIVELYRRRPEHGEVELLGRVYAPDPDGPAVILLADPEHGSLVEALLAEGVIGPAERILHMADGEAFVRALPDGLRGSRFWAERVDRG